MTRRASDTFTGTLRTNDPRRFLVEAMLGAMTADGKVHETEMISMQRHLDEHEVFSGLTERHHTVLLEIARDALRFAGNPTARIPAIAKGLTSRLHKLTGLAMACEVVVADTLVQESEVIFLKLLRRALRISGQDFEEMFQAAKDHRSAADLDARLAHLRELVPHIAQLFALRSLSLRVLTPEHRAQIGELFAHLPDLVLPPGELAIHLDKAYARMHFALDLEVEVGKVAYAMPSMSDRYWTIVYLMCADTASAPHWRSHPFLAMVQRIFGLDAPDVDLAPGDALEFVANFALSTQGRS